MDVTQGRLDFLKYSTFVFLFWTVLLNINICKNVLNESSRFNIELQLQRHLFGDLL